MRLHMGQLLQCKGVLPTFPNVLGTILGNMKLFIPAKAKQEKLVDVLDSLLAETQRLESLYQNKLNALAELKKSLLHQAFSGNL